MSHISKEQYFDKLHGMVYRKDMDKFVAHTFQQMYDFIYIYVLFKLSNCKLQVVI